MADENIDANTDTVIEEVTTDVEDSGSSPEVETQAIVDDDGMISTDEFEPIEEVEVQEEVDSHNADTDDDTSQKTDSDTSKDKDFHDHPRFQEVIQQKNEAKTEAEAARREIAELKAAVNKQQQFKPEEVKPQDPQESLRLRELDKFMAMDNDDLSEMIINEPSKYRALSMQQLDREQTARSEQQAKVQNQQSIQERTNQTLKKFFEDKPDGVELVQSGQIHKFIEENPGHNAISAYHEIKGEDQYQERLATDVKKETDKIYQTLKAKGNAGSISTTTGSKSYNGDSAEMNNPEKFGGRNAVLLKRMLARQDA